MKKKKSRRFRRERERRGQKLEQIGMWEIQEVERMILKYNLRKIRGGGKYCVCFLILNFRRVLIVVSFLLGKSPASVY